MKTIGITLLFGFVSIICQAQDYYWIGGSGNWSDLSHWATTSGGNTVHTQLPDATNNVFFDANSFTASSQVVTLDVTANCNSMDWSGVSNFPTITGNGNELNIFGSLTLAADMTADFNVIEFESTDAGNTITTNGTSLGASALTRFRGIGGTWDLQDIFTTNNLYILAGTLTTNNNTINAGTRFQTSGSDAKILNLGASQITTSRWWMFGTNQTINAGTSKIITSNMYADNTNDGPFTYYDVEFTNYAILQNSATFNEITFEPGIEVTLTSGDTYTLTNLVANGTKHQPIKIGASTPGTEATFTKTSGTITIDFAELTDVHATGGATFTANNSVDNGNTTGWTINPITSQDYYWVGNGGNWSDFANHWATTSGGSTMHTDYPGSADNVYFDANSFNTAAQTVTLDVNASAQNMDWTGTTNSPTFYGAYGIDLTINGNLTFAPEVNKSLNDITLTGSGSYTHSTQGSVQNFTVAASGTYSLQDSVSFSSFNLYSGTLNTNNQPIHVFFNLTVLGDAGGTTLNLGSSNVYANQFAINNYSNQPTILPGTSLLNLTTGIYVQSNTISNFQFNKVIITGAGSIKGSNTFDELTLAPGASVSFEDNETTTITSNFILNGTKAAPITLGSSVTGTQSTISMASGTVNGTYLILQDIAATGGATFNATQTIDNGNNNGWNITGLTGVDYYWVGNGGDWSDFANHWATSSGGATMQTTAPGVLDNVIFDANSFNTDNEIVNIDEAQVSLANLDASAAANSFTIGGSGKEMNIYGSVDVPANVYVKVSTLNFLSTGTETLSFNGGPGSSYDVNFRSSGTWTLQSNMVVDELLMESGTLNTNNKNLTVSFQLRFIQTNPKTLNLGTSVLEVGSWTTSGASNITINGGASELIIHSSFNQYTTGTNSITLNNLTLDNIGTGGSTLYSDIDLNKLTITPGSIVKPVGDLTITANTFDLNGVSGSPIVMEPQTAGSSLTFSKASGVVDAYYLEMQDVIANGGATFNAYNSVDNGGVIGWIFHRLSQTITFDALPNKAFGDADFDVTATASSGLPVTFTVLSGPATLSGNTLSITGTGTVSIKAEQAGNIDYDPAPSVIQSFEVSPASQSINFTALTDKTFGDAPFDVSATATSGLDVSFSVVSGPISITGTTVTITGAGTAEIKATQAGDANYQAASDVIQSFTIAKAAQTIDFEPLPDVVLGETTSVSLTATASSGLAIAFAVTGPATLAGTTLTPTGVGTVTITASQIGDANYNAATEVVQSFEVTDPVLGVANKPLTNIHLYPQPAHNQLIIWQTHPMFTWATIYNLKGEQLQQVQLYPKSTELDVASLTNGIYIVRLQNSQQVQQVKIVIAH